VAIKHLWCIVIDRSVSIRRAGSFEQRGLYSRVFCLEAFLCTCDAFEAMCTERDIPDKCRGAAAFSVGVQARMFWFSLQSGAVAPCLPPVPSAALGNVGASLCAPRGSLAIDYGDRGGRSPSLVPRICRRIMLWGNSVMWKLQKQAGCSQDL